MTDEELAGQPGAVATRSEDEADAAASEPVFTPKDFRLNLGARLAGTTEDPAPAPARLGVVADEPLASVAARLGVVDDEPLPNLDSPAIRKLTWEHVVPDRPASSAPSAATLVPLPPPRRVPPPPPQPASAFQPPAPAASPEPAVEHREPEPDVVDDVAIDEEVEVAEVYIDEVDIDEFEEIDEGQDDIDEVVELEEFDDEDDDIEEVQQVPAAAEVARQSSPVQPEVNRLAYVPDAFDDEDDAPIELPPITPSGPIVTHAQPPTPTYVPVLAETLYIPPPSLQTSMVAAVVVDQGKRRKGKKGKAQPGRKPKRHLFRSFMTLVLLFGLLAGGAFAAKKYLLHEATWSVELKPLADEVAATRGLEFSKAVTVTPVPVADYASRLAGSAIDTSGQTLPIWRALGLLNGELDLGAVGRQAMNDSPAFYDPKTKTIYVSDDLAAQTHLYKFAMQRAMTVALLDQQYDWSERVSTASPAAAFALRAIIDADALAVANTLAANNNPELLAPELLAFVQGHGDTVSTSPYAANLAGRIGVALRPKIAATDPAALAALEQATPVSDDIFDARRSPALVASPPGTQGMMFWYYVLASRIDDGQAWAAATRWVGDSLVTTTGQCVDAKIAAADADGAAVLLATFTSWAAAAPAESVTVVVPMEGNQVAIRACDPGATLSAQLPAKVPVAFGGAGVEGALVVAADTAAGDATVDATCLITAARQRTVTLASPADDSPVLAIGWQPAYVPANLDLGTGCVAAAPVVPEAPAPAVPVEPAAPAP